MKDRQRKYFAEEGSKKQLIGSLMNSFQKQTVETFGKRRRQA